MLTSLDSLSNLGFSSRLVHGFSGQEFVSSTEVNTAETSDICPYILTLYRSTLVLVLV